MYPFRTRLAISAFAIAEKPLQITLSRRADSNRGPLHYEGRTSEGRASTRVHSRARKGTFSLENRQFFSSGNGRACPLVPKLTYPFCTRPDGILRRT